MCYPLSGLLPGLIDLDNHAIIADRRQVSQLEGMHVDAVEEALALSDHDREDHQPELVDQTRIECCRGNVCVSTEGLSKRWAIAGTCA
jgi:hypothetical protein